MKPVLRYPGSKWSMAGWIVDHMPPHKHYLEPYFGSGAVFFSKPRSKVETINDINGDVVNLFSVLRTRPEELAAAIYMTPWARAEYYESYNRTGDPFEDARRFLVRCWQAYGARINWRSGWKNQVAGSAGKVATAVWQDLPARILSVAERLRGVQIEQVPALELITRCRNENVLIYADPPYLGWSKRGLYSEGMEEAEHLDLLKALKRHPGPVILSGYFTDLYHEELDGWIRRDKKAMAEGGRAREECIWINPVAAEALEGCLFVEAP
ncbi:MAG: DNA adenine methylase [Sphaerochaeta sp.]|nr:DNA adenine methylase [Sphaerochaeta sp.]